MMYQQHPHLTQVQTRNNHARRSLWKPNPLAAAIVATCSGLSAASLPASAQELEEILVTATRRETAITDIPINITVISSDDLKAKRAFGLGELTRIVPGVAFIDEGPISRGNNNTIILRGLNAAASDNNTNFPNQFAGAVATYLGETPVFFNMTLKDLERVEVLRGPQGTLYGSGSVGGTIRFLPNKPSFDDGFNWEIDANTYLTEDSDEMSYGTDMIVNIPLIENQLAARVAGGYLRDSGFIDAVGRVATGAGNLPLNSIPGDLNSGFVNAPKEDVNDTDKWWVRASLLWQPTENFSVNFLYQHEDIEMDARQVIARSFTGGVLDTSNENPGGVGPNEFGCPSAPASLAAIGYAPFACLGPGGQSAFPNGSAVFPAPGDNENLIGLGEEPWTVNADVVNAEVNIDFGFATLTSSTSYHDVEQTFVRDISGFFEAVRTPGGFPVNAFYGYMPNLLGLIGGWQQDEAVTQELRLVSNWDRRWDYVVGFYYEDSEDFVHEDNAVPGFYDFCAQAGITLPGSASCYGIFGVPPGFVGDNSHLAPDPLVGDILFNLDRKLDFEDIALFGQLTFHVTDQWQITGGIRSFWQEISVDYIQTLPFCGAGCAEDLTDPLGTTAVGPVKSNFQDQIFMVNTSYDISDNMLAYFTWSEGFRRGGSNTLPTAGFYASLPNFITYEPDQATNYEIGLKGRNLFGRFTYSLAGYYIDWENFQFEALSPGGLAGVFNGEAARSLGVEVQARGKIAENLSLDIGYSYTDAQITEDFTLFDLAPFTGELVTGQQMFDGDPLPGVPEHSVAIGLDYFQPLKFGNGWTLNYHVDGSFRDETQSTFNPTSQSGLQYYEMDSFWIWNASLTLNAGNWDAGFFIRNLGNEEGISGGGEAGGFGFRGESLNIVRPRTFGLTVSYRYQ